MSTQMIADELNSNHTKLQVITSNRERIVSKKLMLIETLEKFNNLGKLFNKLNLFYKTII